MPVLIVLELLSGGDGQQRRLQAWHCDKIVLLILHYLILPQALLWKAMQQCHFSKRIAPAGVVIGQLCWLYFSQALGLSIMKSRENVDFSADTLFSYFCVCGTAVVAMLSGFGAVYSPFCNITTFLRTEPSADDVSEMENRISNTETMCLKKKQDKRKLQEEMLQDTVATSNTFLGRIYGMFNFVSSIKSRNQVARMDADIEALEYLSLEMQLELNDLVDRRDHSIHAKSRTGRVFNCMGWLMTLCCLIKLFNSLRNILFDRRLVHDPAMRFLTIICEDILGTSIDVRVWSPTLSLAFVGYLTFANTRSFVMQLLITLRYFTTQVSNDAIALLICVITGMYFAASSLLMRVYLPESYRQELNATLGFDDRHAFQMLFDKVFVIFAIISTIAITGNRYYKNQKFRTF
eukprot:GEMP01039145.1.p1 GENE.GEMP01039145.1~~GEMP01039145.1.p1  ORF type:complete len:406 (+),score=38.55 GEMP01039145.1:242-1459(+)